MGFSLTYRIGHPKVNDSRPEGQLSTDEKNECGDMPNLLYRVSKNPRISLSLSRTAALLEVFGRQRKLE
jgi:hypothetical protein